MYRCFNLLLKKRLPINQIIIFQANGKLESIKYWANSIFNCLEQENESNHKNNEIEVSKVHCVLRITDILLFFSINFYHSLKIKLRK